MTVIVKCHVRSGSAELCVAHLPSLERPDEFNFAVQSFLDRLR